MEGWSLAFVSMAHYTFDLREIGQNLDVSLVVVMPIYNEETNLRSVIGQWSECLRALSIRFRIIALDDGSRDRTSDVLQELESINPGELCVITKPNAGHGITCRNGYEIAAHSSAEWVLQIDSDGQCEPKHFAAFWQQREANDCIFGLRTSRDDGLVRIATSAICRVTSSLVCGQDLRDPNVPYRLMRRTALDRALRYIPANFNIQNVALTYVLKKLPDLRWEYVPIHFPRRKAGEASLNILKVVTWGAEMLFELLRIRVPAPPAA